MPSKINNSKGLIFCIIATLLIASLVVTFSYSKEDTVNSIINELEVIEGDYIIAEEYVVNKGVIIGDFISASNQVENHGMVEGDIIAVSASLLLKGKLKGDLRTATTEATIDGEINRNATIFANHILISDDAVIDGSIHTFANTVNIKGFVGGDVRGAVASSFISGNIKGNVTLYTNRIEFEPGALIEGDLTYISENQQNIDKQYVKGTIKHKYPTALSAEKQIENHIDRWKAFSIIRRIVFLISYLAIGSFSIMMFKKPFIRAASIVQEKSWVNLLVGLGALIGIPILAVLFMLLIIGIPLGVILVALYGILIYLAKIPVEIWLGNKIYRESPHPVISFLIGSLLLQATLLVPIVGWWASKAVMVVGIGATLIMIKEYYKGKEYGIGNRE
ncbi:polymer-forming cytoskeletal protein [Alkaliphilus pronyensis]|nr:polymer-forming cytoskeletal protein [Alkaliphilus pronyensis]